MLLAPGCKDTPSHSKHHVTHQAYMYILLHTGIYVHMQHYVYIWKDALKNRRYRAQMSYNVDNNNTALLDKNKCSCYGLVYLTSSSSHWRHVASQANSREVNLSHPFLPHYQHSCSRHIVLQEGGTQTINIPRVHIPGMLFSDNFEH